MGTDADMSGSTSDNGLKDKVGAKELEHSPPDVESSPAQVDGVSKHQDSSKHGQRPEVFRTTFQEVMFVAAATFAVGSGSFVIGAVVVLSSFVGRSLDMTTPEISWIAAASGLATGSFILFFGRFADFFGRKSIFVWSLGVFTIFALGTGFSQTGITLDVLSGLMGLTSASAVPSSLGILGAAYKPSKRKNYAFACFSAGNPLGFVVGLIISGVLTQLLSWRATFWAIAIIYALVTVFAFFVTPKDTSDKKSLSLQTAKEFDIVGAILTVAGIAMFSAGLTQGSEAGWGTPYVIVLIVLGVAAVVAFVFWEKWYSYPLIPMSIWKDRNFSLLMIMNGLGSMVFPVYLFWVALYTQRVLKLEPILVAVHMFPAAVSGTLVNVVAAFILHRVSNKLLMFIGAVAYTIAFLLMAVQRDGDSYWAFTFTGLSIAVIGADFQFNVCNMYIMSSRPREEQSLAGGILQTVARLCMTIGYGIATAVFDSVQKNPPTSGYFAHNAAAPYSAVFSFCAAATGVSILLVPFLTINTQGNESPEKIDREEGSPAVSEASSPIDLDPEKNILPAIRPDIEGQS